MYNIRYQYDGKQTRPYGSWNAIKHAIKNDPRLSMCEEFAKYEDYYDWYTSQNGHNIAGWKLNKTLFDKHNIQYTPDALCLLPPKIYGALNLNKRARGPYPIGVSAMYCASHCTLQAFMSYGNNQSECLGSFDNELDAFNMYKREKEKYVRKLAEEYKSMLDQRVYLAMMNYTVEITD